MYIAYSQGFGVPIYLPNSGNPKQRNDKGAKALGNLPWRNVPANQVAQGPLNKTQPSMSSQFKNHKKHSREKKKKDRSLKTQESNTVIKESR